MEQVTEVRHQTHSRRHQFQQLACSNQEHIILQGHRFWAQCRLPFTFFWCSCVGIFSTIKLFTLLPHFHGGLCERHTRHKRTYSHIFRHTCRILYPYPLAFSSCHQEVVKEHNVKTRMSTHEVKVERKNTQSKRCCRSGWLTACRRHPKDPRNRPCISFSCRCTAPKQIDKGN